MTFTANHLRRLALPALAALALGGCYYDEGINSASYGGGYGDSYNGGYNGGYDGGYAGADCVAAYGADYWSADPYGYDDGYGYDCYDPRDYQSGFAQIGFGGGWFDNYYYPGYGFSIFDSYGGRHALAGQHLRYWGGRRAYYRHHGHRDHRPARVRPARAEFRDSYRRGQQLARQYPRGPQIRRERSQGVRRSGSRFDNSAPAVTPTPRATYGERGNRADGGQPWRRSDALSGRRNVRADGQPAVRPAVRPSARPGVRPGVQPQIEQRRRSADTTGTAIPNRRQWTRPAAPGTNMATGGRQIRRATPPPSMSRPAPAPQSGRAVAPPPPSPRSAAAQAGPAPDATRSRSSSSDSGRGRKVDRLRGRGKVIDD